MVKPYKPYEQPIVWTYEYSGKKELDTVGFADYKPESSLKVTATKKLQDFRRASLSGRASIATRPGVAHKPLVLGPHEQIVDEKEAQRELDKVKEGVQKDVDHPALASMCVDLMHLDHVFDALRLADFSRHRCAPNAAECDMIIYPDNNANKVKLRFVGVVCRCIVEDSVKGRVEMVDLRKANDPDPQPLFTYDTTFEITLDNKGKANVKVLKHRMTVHDEIMDEKCPWLYESVPLMGRLQNAFREFGNFIRNNKALSVFLGLCLIGAAVATGFLAPVALIYASVGVGVILSTCGGAAAYDYLLPHRLKESVNKTSKGELTPEQDDSSDINSDDGVPLVPVPEHRFHVYFKGAVKSKESYHDDDADTHTHEMPPDVESGSDADSHHRVLVVEDDDMDANQSDDDSHERRYVDDDDGEPPSSSP